MIRSVNHYREIWYHWRLLLQTQSRLNVLTVTGRQPNVWKWKRRNIFLKMTPLLLFSLRSDSSSANADIVSVMSNWSITLNSKRSDLLILLCELVKINLGFLTESNIPIREFCKIISLGCCVSIFSFRNLLRNYWTASLQKAQHSNYLAVLLDIFHSRSYKKITVYLVSTWV